MLCNYCNSNHVVKPKYNTKSSYESFSKRNGYFEGVSFSSSRTVHRPLQYTLGDYFDKQIPDNVRKEVYQKLETNEYSNYKEFIYHKNLISLEYLKNIHVKYLRKIMDKHIVSRIDWPWGNVSHIELAFNNENLKWAFERLLWISSIKLSGLFANIPNDIILKIITIVNTTDLPASMINHCYHNFVREIQDGMFDYEFKNIKICEEKVKAKISTTYHSKRQCYKCPPCYNKRKDLPSLETQAWYFGPGVPLPEYYWSQDTYDWCNDCTSYAFRSDERRSGNRRLPALPTSNVNKQTIFSRCSRCRKGNCTWCTGALTPNPRTHEPDFVIQNEIRSGIYNNLPNNVIVWYAKFLMSEKDEPEEQGLGWSNKFSTLHRKFFKKKEYYVNMGLENSQKESEGHCMFCDGECNNNHYSMNEIVKKCLVDTFPEIQKGESMCCLHHSRLQAQMALARGHNCDCIDETHQMSNDEFPSHVVYKYLYDQTYGYFKVKQNWVPFAIPSDPQFYGVEISESFQFYFVNNTGLVHHAIGKIVFKRNGGFHDIMIKKWRNYKTTNFLRL